MKVERLWTRPFLMVCTANFFLFVTYYYLLVTLPTAALNHFHAPGSIAGLFTTLFLGAAIVIRPFVSSWMMKFGKRSILIASLVIFFAASFLYGWFDSVIALLVLRFLHGIGFGMATTVTGSIVADLVPDARKGEGMGYFIMSANLAMVAGPFLGLTIFGDYGLAVMFWIGAIFSFAALLLGWLTGLPEEPKIESNVEKKQAVFEKSAIPIAITGAFFAVAYSSILSFMAVFAAQRGLSDESGYFFAVYAAVLLLTRPFTGRWFDQYGANSIIFPAIVLFAIGMLTLGLSNSTIVFFIAAACIGIGWGTLFPSFQTIAVQRCIPKRRPAATATFLSIFDLGIGIGSFLAGALAGVMELGTLYIGCSIYIISGLALYWRAQKQAGQRQAA
ncbi:MFS transporter [Domibacillus epiphyticus]|uniref:MFS transporter n=1 Tax=Domibacillus epiphyticus TaxID=1714355 RepID=A0A1V2A5C1_9BACI|nr:MFS transporter [Domibacillus epiphyticus]OMP66004.1 MFS transporter [Domibacillus epiphyticus]